MSRGKFKGEFVNELMFFSMVVNRDLKVLTKENAGVKDAKDIMEVVEEDLIKTSSSFYGSRLEYDKYGVKKSRFIARYAEEIVKGKINEKDIDELYDEIEDEEELIRGHKL